MPLLTCMINPTINVNGSIKMEAKSGPDFGNEL